MGLRELKPIGNSRVRRRVVEVVGDRGTRDGDLGTVTNITKSTYYKGRRRDMKLYVEVAATGEVCYDQS
ncbi:hypothetical protein F2Q70_00030438 [Brassica cretica]|uniref:Uncharacterized protein n=1 Tax=Brassica cretica TaxID=69181 RepID=A0A8S9FJW5_BRACR|nr:hypothetical protein F2Q70_00030438 [Brassica cretica]